MTGVEFVLPPTLGVLLAILLNRVLAHMPAATRCTVWAAAIGGALVLPVLGPILSQLPVSGSVVLPSMAEELRSSMIIGAHGLKQWFPSTTFLWMLWGAGAIVLFLRMISGLVRLALVAGRSIPVTDLELLAEARGLAAGLGIRRPVRFHWTRDFAVPVTFGVLRPVVLLPSQVADWTPDQRRSVLIHELAHVRRLDALTLVWATLAGCLHWFNPLVWFAIGRLRAEQEHACDDHVLRAGVHPPDYVKHLVSSARGANAARQTKALLVPSMLGGTDLRDRATSLLHPQRFSRAQRPSRTVLTGTVFLAALVLLGALAAPAVDVASNSPLPLASKLTPLSAARSVAEEDEDPGARELGPALGNLRPLKKAP